MARGSRSLKRAVNRISRGLVGALLLAGLSAGQAGAVTPPEPTTHYLAPPVVYPLTVPDVSQFQPTFTGSDYRPGPRLSGFRSRSISLLKYDTPLQLGQNDLIFKFRAPGARRTIVHFEFIFF